MSLQQWGFQPQDIIKIRNLCTQFPKEASRQIIITLQSGAKKTLSQMQSYPIPRDTGYMASNTVIENIPNGVQIVSKAEYAIYVDQGTYRMPKRPFFSDTVEKNIPVMAESCYTSFITTLSRFIGT